MNNLSYQYLLPDNFFFKSNPIKLLPIKPNPPVTSIFFFMQ